MCLSHGIRWPLSAAWPAVSYTHLDVYKRQVQAEAPGQHEEGAYLIEAVFK